MKGFALKRVGDRLDLDLTGKTLHWVEGEALLRQSVECVLGTNMGEWFLNPREGIRFSTLLTKEPNWDLIRNEVRRGLLQVDETFFLSQFTHALDRAARTLTIAFTAVNADGQTVRGGVAYAG